MPFEPPGVKELCVVFSIKQVLLFENELKMLEGELWIDKMRFFECFKTQLFLLQLNYETRGDLKVGFG